MELENSKTPIISFHTEDKDVLKIERDGVIKWLMDGENMSECHDFKDLAKGFMYVIYQFSPSTDWKGLAPEIYEEIKHLINPTPTTDVGGKGE